MYFCTTQKEKTFFKRIKNDLVVQLVRIPACHLVRVGETGSNPAKD